MNIPVHRGGFLPNQYEIELSFRLGEGSSPSEIVDESFMSLHEGRYSKADKKAILIFALNAGYKKKVIRTLREWPRKETYFPWDLFFTTLLKCNEKLSDDDFDQLFHFIQKQKSFFFMAPAFSEINKKFDEKIKQFRSTMVYESQKKVRLLWEKLDFVQTRGLKEEEAKILEKIRTYDSENPDLAQHIENLEKRLAHSAVTKVKLQKNPPRLRTDHVCRSKLEPYELEHCQVMLEHIQKLKPRGDHSYFDFAIHFYNLEAYSFSLSCIQKAPPSPTQKWIELELLYLTSRYFECIDLADQLISEHQDSPDVNFAGLYQKALAQWSIGSKNEAIEIMKAIVNTRPNYRSAYQVLHAWLESQY